MGLNVYLDPETKRQNYQLQFTPETWAVTPLWYLGMPNWHNQSRTRPALGAPTFAWNGIESNGTRESRRAVSESSSDSVWSNTEAHLPLRTAPIKLRGGGSRYTWRGKALYVRLPISSDHRELPQEQSSHGSDSPGSDKPIPDSKAQGGISSTSSGKTTLSALSTLSNTTSASHHGGIQNKDANRSSSADTQSHPHQFVDLADPSSVTGRRAIAIPRSVKNSKGASTDTSARLSSNDTHTQTFKSMFLVKGRSEHGIATTDNSPSPPTPPENGFTSTETTNPSSTPSQTPTSLSISDQSRKLATMSSTKAPNFSVATEKISSASLLHAGSHVSPFGSPLGSNSSANTPSRISPPSQVHSGSSGLLGASMRKAEGPASPSSYGMNNLPPDFRATHSKGYISSAKTTLFAGNAPFLSKLENFSQRLILNFQSLPFRVGFSAYSFDVSYFHSTCLPPLLCADANNKGC